MSGLTFVSRFSSISSIEAPDAQTVVLKLKAPDAALLHQLAVGYAWVIAKRQANRIRRAPVV